MLGRVFGIIAVAVRALVLLDIFPQNPPGAARIGTQNLDILTRVSQMHRKEQALAGVGAAEMFLRTADGQLVDQLSERGWTLVMSLADEDMETYVADDGVCRYEVMEG